VLVESHAGGCRCGHGGHWQGRGLGKALAVTAGVQCTGSGVQANKKGRTVPAVLIRLPGIAANGMTANPEDGRPGGAVRRVSQCQSAVGSPFKRLFAVYSKITGRIAAMLLMHSYGIFAGECYN
jgi:hypothetical protein